MNDAVGSGREATVIRVDATLDAGDDVGDETLRLSLRVETLEATRNGTAMNEAELDIWYCELTRK